MKKHHSEVFKGVLAPSVHEKESIERSPGNGTGLTRRSQGPTVRLSGARTLMERVSDYRNKMESEKKNFLSQVSDPTPNPEEAEEFFVVVNCSWDEAVAIEPESLALPVAPSAMPDRASRVPKVRSEEPASA